MLVHRQAIDRPERPRFWLRDRSTLDELRPEPQEHLLDGIGGLRVRDTQPPNESEQRLAVATLEVEDDRLVGLASHRRLDRFGAQSGRRRHTRESDGLGNDFKLAGPHVPSTQQLLETLRQSS